MGTDEKETTPLVRNEGSANARAENLNYPTPQSVVKDEMPKLNPIFQKNNKEDLISLLTIILGFPCPCIWMVGFCFWNSPSPNAAVYGKVSVALFSLVILLLMLGFITAVVAHAFLAQQDSK